MVLARTVVTPEDLILQVLRQPRAERKHFSKTHELDRQSSTPRFGEVLNIQPRSNGPQHSQGAPNEAARGRGLYLPW